MEWILSSSWWSIILVMSWFAVTGSCIIFVFRSYPLHTPQLFLDRTIGLLNSHIRIGASASIGVSD